MNHQLSQLLLEIEQYIPKYELRNENISKASIGWQLTHSLKVIIMIIQSLKRSNNQPFKTKFHLLKFVLFNLGKFPRGAKAPQRVKPDENEINPHFIQKQLEEAKSLVNEYKYLNNYSFIEHPKFGKLNAKESYRFLCIHTEHHLKIVREIIKQ